MTAEESRRRETDSQEETQPRRRATDQTENATYGRRATDRSPDTRYGRRKTDRPVREKPGRGIRAFGEAWAIIIILALILALTISLTSRPVKIDVTSVTVATPALPGDVPVFPGAALSRYAASGQTATYNYSIAQGAKASVQSFYRTELTKRGWVRQPNGNDTTTEYKINKRRLVITLRYEGGHILMQIRIVNST